MRREKPDSVKLALAKTLRKTAEQLVSNNENGFEFEHTLECMCAICSNALKKLFDEYGFPSKVYYGRWLGKLEHCWVEDETHIWDITATQFENITEKVICLPKEDPLVKGFYKRKRVMTKIKDYSKWVPRQIPNKAKVSRLIQEHQKMHPVIYY